MIVLYIILAVLVLLLAVVLLRTGGVPSQGRSR